MRGSLRACLFLGLCNTVWFVVDCRLVSLGRMRGGWPWERRIRWFLPAPVSRSTVVSGLAQGSLTSRWGSLFWVYSHLFTCCCAAVRGARARVLVRSTSEKSKSWALTGLLSAVCEYTGSYECISELGSLFSVPSNTANQRVLRYWPVLVFYSSPGDF